MKELWVKKNIWRRYLVDDSDIEEISAIIKNGEHLDAIENIYDKNERVEYDNEETIKPVQFEIQEINAKGE